MELQWLLVVCYVLISSLPNGFASQTVKFAAVLYRHGARTPVSPYPLDPYKDESKWPEKFGQLTNTGKMQHFMLGEWLRDRYKHLISERYDPDEVYISSTNVDRTIMSAQINTAGLYPPKGKEVWDDKLKWQPIPIRTVSEHDEVLAMGKKCPAYTKEMNRYMESKEYLDLLELYTPLMKYVSAHTGAEITNFSSLEYIYSTLKIEHEQNFTLPSWTEKVFPDAMRPPSCFSFKQRTITSLLARLKAGPLLKEITHSLQQAALGRKNAKKLIVYSAHDNTVANLLGVLRVMDDHCPPYTATVFLELVTDDSDTSAEPLVRLLYRNSSAIVEPDVIPIPGCEGDLCPLNRFLALYKNVTDIDFKRDCQVKKEKQGSLSQLLYNGVVLMLYLFGLTYYIQ